MLACAIVLTLDVPHGTWLVVTPVELTTRGSDMMHAGAQTGSSAPARPRQSRYHPRGWTGRPDGGIPMHVGSVVVDCNDFARMLAFWRAALRYVPRDPPEEGWVVLRDPEGRHVNVSLQLVPEKRIGKNRLHLDLYTENQEEEVRRLLELGATRYPRTSEPGEDFVTLEDPEGNLFDVIDKAGA